jgi:hypothetical protein
LGIPAFYMAILWCNKEKLDESQVKEAYGELYADYDDSYCLWEIMEIFRKILLLGISQVFDETYFRIIFCMSIQLTYILLIENVKPFRDDEDDRLNSFASFQLILTMLLGHG